MSSAGSSKWSQVPVVCRRTPMTLGRAASGASPRPRRAPPGHPGGGTPMHTAKLAAALLVLLAPVLGAAPARSETTNCTAITTLPAVIIVQGIYCFTGDLATAVTTGNAIEIQTNNVVLDLNGFKLGGLAAGLGTGAVGVRAADRQNIT